MLQASFPINKSVRPFLLQSIQLTLLHLYGLRQKPQNDLLLRLGKLFKHPHPSLVNRAVDFLAEIYSLR